LPIQEIFPNPTVKQVIFQIRFPNLFYLESRIGEFQLKVMKEFPESALLFRRQVVFADVGPEGKLENIPQDSDGKKIWQFKSPKNFELSVLSNSLDITSKYHKTYNLEGSDKFREIIDYVLKAFFEIMQVPIITRIGLRYIDECPIPAKNNETFRNYYNSVFPLDRFKLDDSDQMLFQATIKRDKYSLRYVEKLSVLDNKYKLILDFDGSAVDIIPENCLQVTDDLHEIILNEFETTIKEPVYELMRNKQ
jgi:uncharacterized protein (TIGR04255 family)